VPLESGVVQTTVYHYNLQGALITETNSVGVLGKEYLWNGIEPLAQIQNNEITYLHSDHLYTARLGTGDSAAIDWRWDSDAFGDSKPQVEAKEVNLRFPGQYYDEESGLNYNWNRYYDPEIGRYVTSDPIGVDGGLNTFLYSISNPLIWFDYSGLKSCNDCHPEFVECIRNARDKWIKCLKDKPKGCLKKITPKKILKCLVRVRKMIFDCNLKLVLRDEPRCLAELKACNDIHCPDEPSKCTSAPRGKNPI